MQDYNKLFNDKMSELLKDKIFPLAQSNEVPETAWKFSELDFKKHVLNALRFHNEATLECSISEYENVYKFFRYPTPEKFGIPMQIMYVALQATMSILPNQMFTEHEVSQYYQTKRQLINMKAQWDNLASPYTEQAKKYVNEVSKRDQREAEAKARIFKLSGRPANA